MSDQNGEFLGSCVDRSVARIRGPRRCSRDCLWSTARRQQKRNLLTLSACDLQRFLWFCHWIHWIGHWITRYDDMIRFLMRCLYICTHTYIYIIYIYIYIYIISWSEPRSIILLNSIMIFYSDASEIFLWSLHSARRVFHRSARTRTSTSARPTPCQPGGAHQISSTDTNHPTTNQPTTNHQPSTIIHYS